MFRAVQSLFLPAVAAFAVLLGPAAQAAGNPNRADLLYDPGTGNVKIDTSEAAGAKITSFQLENGQASFIPTNYNSPGGSFGGVLEDVTTSVIADTDPGGTGFTGIHDFGNIFPTAMDQAELQTYLTTRVYTGQAGSGQQTLDVQLVTSRVVTGVPVSSPATLGALGVLLLGLGVFASRKRLQAQTVQD